VIERAARLVSALAAFYCAAAVGLGAYSAHSGLMVDDQLRLDRAVLYLFLTGIGALALRRAGSRAAGQADTPLTLCASLVMVGAALFSGSLVGAALFGGSTALAPMGGVLMILGWVLSGFALLRRSI